MAEATNTATKKKSNKLKGLSEQSNKKLAKFRLEELRRQEREFIEKLKREDEQRRICADVVSDSRMFAQLCNHKDFNIDDFSLFLDFVDSIMYGVDNEKVSVYDEFYRTRISDIKANRERLRQERINRQLDIKDRLNKANAARKAKQEAAKQEAADSDDTDTTAEGAKNTTYESLINKFKS